ncbi:uncharacterized protein [Aegilops tauschii subsp. strangulata]|uniref:uncharacterized protein n=1 Tax=Aegilops tauschii subsp. strangulata TaxID=200361 RepID=UPI003CC8B2AF
MGSREESRARLRIDVWDPVLRVTDEENEGLRLAFLPQEIDVAVLGMKSNTAPGPNGWPVAMFNRFWTVLKGPIFDMCNGFMRCSVDISRLNIGVLSLIPKGFLVGVGSPHDAIGLGGQTTIAVNGEVGNFFCKKRGLRQGDPASPLLFNFVGDALGAMLDQARAAGNIRGVVGDLIPGGVSRLQYADDTLLFEPDLHNIAMVKGILLCFELMSRLKINFHKCEVVSIGMDAAESLRVANLLNCKLGKLPFTYLGLLIAEKKWLISDWEPLWNKMAGRVCPWRGRFTSSGARLILTNSSLSSLPMFVMGLFLLADGVHTKMDTPRARFFWEGAGPKHKYHMVKWQAVCRPKAQGGLGIINSKLMKIALMCKWIWKLSQGETGLWMDLLRAKYFPGGNFFEAATQGSPFWNSIQSLKPFSARGAKFTVNNDRSTRLWLDLWIVQQPLWSEFRDLYSIAVDPNQLVATRFSSSPPSIYFRRELSGPEVDSWDRLWAMTADVHLSSDADTVSWRFTGPALQAASGL